MARAAEVRPWAIQFNSSVEGTSNLQQQFGGTLKNDWRPAGLAVTIALPIVGVPLAKRLSDFTGGSQGLSARFGESPEGSGLYDDQWQLYLVLLIGGGAVIELVAWRVRNPVIRIGFSLFVIAVVALIWIEGAVGIFH